METLTRCYRYALQPTTAQREQLDQASVALRRLWNELVALQRYAEKEIRFGRHATLKREYATLLLKKEAVGRAVSKARLYATARGVSEKVALNLARLEAVEKTSRLIRTKTGRPLRRLSRRQFAVEYAIERATANAAKKQGIMPPGGWALITKFRDAVALYVKGTRGAPRFKRAGESISLQFQTQTKPGFDCRSIDLSKLGGQILTRVPWRFHRPLSDESKIKQIAVTIRDQRYFAVFFIEARATAFAEDFPTTNASAGIDPGRKTALSVASLDGKINETITPPLLRRGGFLRTLARNLRQLDRQRRANNPDCFDEKGRWIRGQRLKVISANMRTTQTRLADLQQHLAAARRETYHLAARDLLNRFDTIGIGTWRGRGRAPGTGRARQAQNRKDYDNAISTFKLILEDKARRSLTEKKIVAISEAGTTRNCPDCGAATGPQGLTDLSLREWACRDCGSHHQRDFASARAIAQRSQTAAAAKSVQLVAITSPRTQRRRSADAEQTQGSASAGQVPVVDEAESREDRPPIIVHRASAAVAGQLLGAARSSKTTGAERVARPDFVITPSSPTKLGNHSQRPYLLPQQLRLGQEPIPQPQRQQETLTSDELSSGTPARAVIPQPQRQQETLTHQWECLTSSD